MDGLGQTVKCRQHRWRDRILYGVLRNDVDGTVLTTATLGSQPQRAEVGSCDGRSKRATRRVRGSSVS
jgi:hypothetical protein